MASEDYTSAVLDARSREAVCQLREQGGLSATLADAIESGGAVVEGRQVVNPIDGAVLAEWQPLAHEVDEHGSHTRASLATGVFGSEVEPSDEDESIEGVLAAMLRKGLIRATGKTRSFREGPQEPTYVATEKLLRFHEVSRMWTPAERAAYLYDESNCDEDSPL